MTKQRKSLKQKSDIIEKTKKIKGANVNQNDFDNLFNFIKIFFGNNPKYNEVTSYQKRKHRFMLQRFMSIRYPDVAQKFNINKINGSVVVDLWHHVGKKYNRTPNWIWTKTKQSTKKKVDKFIPKDETIKFYLRRQDISRRDFNDAMKFHKEELLHELEIIEKTIESDE